MNGPSPRRRQGVRQIRFGEFSEFAVVGTISDAAVIASGHSLRDRRRLRKLYGGRQWRKMKGFAHIELPNGRIRFAELPWYEAHGIGKQEIKIKRYLPPER